jgi:hypothetical protein
MDSVRGRSNLGSALALRRAKERLGGSTIEAQNRAKIAWHLGRTEEHTLSFTQLRTTGCSSIPDCSTSGKEDRLLQGSFLNGEQVPIL